MINTIQDLGFSNCKEISGEQWLSITKCYNLSVQFFEKYYKHIWWNYCSAEQHLSDEFIQNHKDELNWNAISACDKGLSETFIEKYKDKVNWFWISNSQKLSEAFIAKHYKEVNWYEISFYQALSETFIAIFAEYVNWYALQFNRKIHLSERFKQKYANRLQGY